MWLYVAPCPPPCRRRGLVYVEGHRTNERLSTKTDLWTKGSGSKGQNDVRASGTTEDGTGLNPARYSR